MSQRINHIAVALIRQADKILLVQQQGPNDPGPSWSLPGGLVEPGELLGEALVREVREETGLEVLQIGPLLYLTQLDDPAKARQSIAFIFEVTTWRGRLTNDDPDRRVLDACFLAATDAIEKLQSLPWRAMREPAIAYLRGEARPGSVWLYRRQTDMGIQLIQQIP